ncbi:MAG: DUF6770 family protein [Chitinophagaceae bacterium]
MKTPLKNLCLLFLFTLCCCSVFAQSSKLSIDNVQNVTLRNSGSIVEKEEVKGYYFFYQSDKVDKKTNEYTLQILDANLNKLKDIKFQDSKKIALLESSYNGSSLVFMFYDDEQNMIDYRLYDLEGNKSFSYTKTLDKRSEQHFKSAPRLGNDEGSDNANIYDIAGKGFLSIVPVKEGKNFTYEVGFYSSERRRTWTYNPVEDGKFTQAQYLGANDSIAFIEVLSKARITTREMESTLVGINLFNGRKAFETRTQDKGFQLYPMNISPVIGSNNYIVMGPYFESEDRVLQDKSEGLGIWTMDNKGKVLNSKYVSWEKDVSKFLKTDFKGKLADIGFVYFHSLFQTDDGKVFAIGEGYKKTASALGIATTVLGAMVGSQGRGISVAKMTVTDMVVLQLNSNYALENATIHEKRNNNVELPSGFAFTNPHTLALILKGSGSFDYSFTQMGKNKGSFVSGYTDFEKGKDYNGMAFHAISYYDGKMTKDKINLATKASRITVLPARPGSILLMEYFKKEKRIDLRMEKLN